MEEDHPQIEPRAGAPPPQPGEPEDPGVDFSKTKIGQMGPESRRRVLKMLQECKAFFPKHTKVVNVLTGREVELPLYDENAKPFACEAQRFNPHMSDILVDQIKDMLEAGILSFANSEWCAKMVPGKKSDGTYRICIDYREYMIYRCPSVAKMSSCGSDLPGSGLFQGEELLMVVRILTTFVSLTVTSAWCNCEKIRKLSLFFAHWLSGLVAGLGVVVQSTMVSLCWTGSNVVGLVKTLKFIELSASNMYAVTNLAICVNLALVVMSHRTMARVQSVSSTPLLLGFLAISVALAAPIIPLTEFLMTTRTGFFVMTSDKRDNDFINVSFFYVEFFVGICMFFMVAWLLLFRPEEVKECWKIHARVRYYFMLTLSGVAVNLGVGVCGMINTVRADFM
eukprot:g16364.t1